MLKLPKLLNIHDVVTCVDNIPN